MKFLFDLFPIILFFGVFKLAGMNEEAALAFLNSLVGGFVADGGMKADQAPIMLATLVAIVATVFQISYLKLRGRKVDAMLWVSALVIIVFGGLTIYFHNEAFIKWKPTIIYWLFGGAMIVAQFGFKKNMMRQAMEQQIQLPEAVWDRVGIAWILCCLVLGLANLLAAFVIFKDNLSAWVNFKVFGITGILFVFIIAQSMYLSKYIVEEKA